jgi:hypothetical protein
LKLFVKVIINLDFLNIMAFCIVSYIKKNILDVIFG